MLLDGSLHELARVATPRFPTGLTVTEDGRIGVSGEQEPRVATFSVKDDALLGGEGAGIAQGRVGLRDMALSGTGLGRATYVVDERDGQLLAVASGLGESETVTVGHGAFRVARAGDRLVVDCLLDHTIVVFDLDRRGLPVKDRRATIHHDGPLWGFDAKDTPGGLIIAAGGVEDHPLDRTQGLFAFIDSFVYLYRVPPGGPPERLAAVNVSEHGVVTPKAVVLRLAPDGAPTVYAAGYGSDELAEITWPAGLRGDPGVRVRTILPGAASMTLAGDTLVFADPLLDAWFALPLGSAPAPAPVPVPVPVPIPARLCAPSSPASARRSSSPTSWRRGTSPRAASPASPARPVTSRATSTAAPTTRAAATCTPPRSPSSASSRTAPTSRAPSTPTWPRW